mmetsp:Transcript_9543/g.17256  ORF Transcript_9543/g.17256 Transcript_9543/m.17256 type:complete len:105 (+) Transcript_9543:263-577(+)
MMAGVKSEIPDVFFFLLPRDEEVAQIREKEAKLRVITDRKVKEAEEVAARDVENENVVVRPFPRKPLAGASGEDAAAAAGSTSSGMSSPRREKRPPPPCKVILL